MKTVTAEMKAGDLKGIIDLPNYPDNQRVKITVNPNTDENDFDSLLNEIKTFWANHEKADENKTFDDYRMERLLKKINSFIIAEKNLALMDQFQEIVGEDKGWVNEEEMIKDLAEMRRRRMSNENNARH